MIERYLNISILKLKMDWGGSNTSGKQEERGSPRIRSGWCIEMKDLPQLGLSRFELGIFKENGEEPALYKVFRTDAEYALPIIFSEAWQQIDYLKQTSPDSSYFLRVLNPN